MINKIITPFFFAAFGLGVFLLSVCGATVEPEPSHKPAKILLSSYAITIEVDKSTSVSARLTGAAAAENSPINWKSGNSSIAAVDANGTITGHIHGTAWITAWTENGLNESCMVTVTDPGVSETIDGAAKIYPGYQLVWSEEFDYSGKPKPEFWGYEGDYNGDLGHNGYVRNDELQWYQKQNANVSGGMLTIEGKKLETPINNPFYTGAGDWKTTRQKIEYTSSSITTRGKKEFCYGIIEVRARIPADIGSWPAIWTLGTGGDWPLNGEIDIMEFYRSESGVPQILANFAYGPWPPVWDTVKIPLEGIAGFHGETAAEWVKKFHVWRFNWTASELSLYLDNRLLNRLEAGAGVQNPSGSPLRPFQQSHYILLNLALGSNGGSPDSSTLWPMKYDVDYVRVYQQGY
jgi:beta-glucanase (GH16 family)